MEEEIRKANSLIEKMERWKEKESYGESSLLSERDGRIEKIDFFCVCVIWFFSFVCVCVYEEGAAQKESKEEWFLFDLFGKVK